MKKQILFACFVGSALGIAAPASALVQIIGPGEAHNCFVYAKAAVASNAGLAACDMALTESDLSLHDRAGTYVNRGVLKSLAGHTEEAMADYNRSVTLMPELGDAYVDRGSALINLKRYDEALVDINHGITLGMAYPHIGYYDRAVVEELTGQFKESYYDFKHVLELEPDFTLATEQLKNFTVTTTHGTTGG